MVGGISSMVSDFRFGSGDHDFIESFRPACTGRQLAPPSLRPWFPAGNGWRSLSLFMSERERLTNILKWHLQ